ncbi:tetratricopeptide repeat protein [Kingella kingae]|uniref:tetratricopeptide repeat protein n=1 Tax=Kingella kingae TaxID=504 RepID=UPI000305E821|nr:tetratricopeptide repeat protein [Kingella kingae]MDK4554752.1 tetratricopeptide repeat protein [Kingella kingae]MDK4583857.1 tetratricopeptide repeat protein [Kingella kingae]MDK4587826.1 tetratricopeptide repeat protein [Kingella kingae]MDK4596009.1 tetratricopeptide repeat protein [Kingella kingae]MDK4599908.1 tetratricopeptide repeat protein [Kingella kingae]
MLKTFYVGLMFLAASSAFAQKQPAPSANDAIYAQAVAAYQREDFATVHKLLLPLAEQGDATAQHNLAVLYQDGLGTKADIAQALMWYEKAAAQGNAEAQFMAGLLHSDQQQYERAVYWYTLAAKQGHVEAQNNLAARYATGTGVERNIDTAIEWYRKAAEQGHASASHTMQQLKVEFDRNK